MNSDQKTYFYKASGPLDNASTGNGAEDGDYALVIAGTRDATLVQAADFVTVPDMVALLDGETGPAQSLEMLPRVHVMHGGQGWRQ